MMCRQLGVTRAGFYAWQARLPSQHQLDDAAITEQIRSVHASSLNTYGSPRVTQAMRQAGWLSIGRRRVARLMRRAQIQGRSARLYRRRRVGQKAFYKSIPNQQRHLALEATDQVWVGDVTYLRVRQQWRYMAVVMDKYSRRLLGWSLSKRRDAELTRSALRHALQRRQPAPGLIFHTDRGIEYAAHDYRAALSRRGIVQSMNRPGQMNDNAHMESFFHSMKSEYLWGKQFDSDGELRQTLKTYLSHYNHRRLHSSLGHTPPAIFERRTT
jgi:transposase InsO family protein